MSKVIPGLQGTVARHEFEAMATVITMQLAAPEASTVLAGAASLLARLENELSLFRPHSDVARLNASAGGDAVEVSHDTYQVLEQARVCSELSGGAFDITAGQLVRRWRQAGLQGVLPDEAELQALRARVDYRGVELGSALRVRLACPGQQINLGGIGKGYTADCITAYYRACGATSGFVNLGGNFAALGGRPDATPWVVGLKDPFGRSEACFASLYIEDASVVTSGAYFRYFEHEALRYHHIIDPRTGRPSESDLVSVSLVGASSTQADALSTAAFVLGLEGSLDLLDRAPDLEAVLLTTQGEVHVTDGLLQGLRLLQPLPLIVHRRRTLGEGGRG